MDRGINTYTRYDGLEALRLAVAEKQKRFYGMDVDPKGKSSSAPAPRGRSIAPVWPCWTLGTRPSFLNRITAITSALWLRRVVSPSMSPWTRRTGLSRRLTWREW